MYSTRKLFFPILIGFFLHSQCQSHPSHYDQRQTGDLNVAVHFKDIQVVALVDGDLLEDDLDYNYAYDYADFTIRPITKPTTSSGSSTTVKPWVTWPTIPPTSSTKISVTLHTEISSSTSSSSSPSSSSSSSSSSSLSSSSALPSPSSPSKEPTVVSEQTILNSTIEVSTVSNNNDLLSIDRNEQSLKVPSKRCPSGYSLDAKGRCKKILRRRLSFFPLSVKLAPKLHEEGNSKDLRVASWISTSV